MRIVRLLLILFFLPLASCTATYHDAPAVYPTVYEVTGIPAQRIEAVTKNISMADAPLSTIVDARLIEERIGDGNLGPSDYRTFILMQVAPEDIGLWTGTLGQPLAQPAYHAPSQPVSWWLDEERFRELEFYTPGALVNRTHGWIAVDRQRGDIFIYTFTT